MQLLRNLFSGPIHTDHRGIEGGGGLTEAMPQLPAQRLPMGQPGGWGAGQVQALHSWVLSLSLSHEFRSTPPEGDRHCADCPLCDMGL